jgi:hypothetical protein
MEALRVGGPRNTSLLDSAYVYAFDESGPQYEDALKLLFGAVKKRWPEVRTLAVLPWAPSPSLPLDIWVVLYPKLDDGGYGGSGGSDFRKAEAAMVASGKEVWGYHCVSPVDTNHLNTFVDMPLYKTRLIHWLSAARNFSGWLYWYTNWASAHASTAIDKATGRFKPMGMLQANGQLHGFDPMIGKNLTGASLDGQFTNEDGNLVYPGVDGPLASVRLENLRMGVEEWALLQLLESSQVGRIL